ncbi:hypothetical protein C9374_008533 [Naegleria lovaniensis]|uniref:Uncharacterized protein n=1 Tax=Naegleria lovaniensis TaxID=51637 RepID=A0AA88GJT2_NAELO|nr:uncharacterized protein C9374_008533 [Naegleria lovaniensis]KAG2378390.1 hypothetical protein C9374_008533 [Naegleria lovaniensis]
MSSLTAQVVVLKEEEEEHFSDSRIVESSSTTLVGEVTDEKKQSEDPLELLIFEKVQTHGDCKRGFTYSLLKEEENDFKAAEVARKIRMVSLDLPSSEMSNKPSRGKWQLDVYKLPWSEKQVPQRKLYDPEYQISFPLAPVNMSSCCSELLSPQNILKIESSHNHCLLLTKDGVVYSMGDSEFGKLGNGYEPQQTNNHPFIRKPILLMDNAIDIAVGKNHSVIVTNEGNVHTFGCGKYGQLGHGSVKNENVPRVIDDFITRDIKVISASCGDNHTLCLTSTGLVYGFGSGSSGQLGILSFLDRNHDLQIHEKAQLTYVCSPRLVQVMRPVQQETEEYRRLRTKKTFVEMDKICCGADYSAFLTKQGQLWLCGNGLTGVICNGTFVANNFEPTESQFLAPSPRTESSIVTQINLASGSSDPNTLDVNVDMTLDVKMVQPPIPKFLPYCHEKPQSTVRTTPVSRASSSAHWQKYFPSHQQKAEGQTIKFIDISCGKSHIFCLARDQRVFAAGLNFNGQLGIGSRTSQCRLVDVTPHLPHQLKVEGIQQIVCGPDFTILISALGTAFCSGRFPGNTEDSLKFVQVTSLSDLNWSVEKVFSKSYSQVFALCKKRTE